MDKRRITAREIIKDIRAGATDAELMEKYTLSAQGLKSVFDKMINAGVLSHTEIEDRVPMSERTVDLGLFICPACGNIQGKEFVECPRCGFTPPAASGQKEQPKPVSPPKSKGPSIKRPVKSPVVVPAGEEARKDPGQLLVVQLKRTATHCKVVGIIALLLYIVCLAALLFLQMTSSAPVLSAGETVLGMSALAIPALLMVFVVYFSLKTISLIVKMLLTESG